MDHRDKETSLNIIIPDSLKLFLKCLGSYECGLVITNFHNLVFNSSKIVIHSET